MSKASNLLSLLEKKYELPRDKDFRKIVRFIIDRQIEQTGTSDRDEAIKDAIASVLDGFRDFEDAKYAYRVETLYTAEGYSFTGNTVKEAVKLAKKYPELNPFIKKESIDEVIRKKGSQYCVYSEKGKKMGCYPSKKKAKERLRQIHYFKSQK